LGGGDQDSTVSWTHHEIADVAITELKIPNDSILVSRFYDLAFPISLIYPKRELPSREANIQYFGYPIIDSKLEYFSPLSFETYLSSGFITTKRADTKTDCTFFYLDSPSIQGCSGSGVYVGVQKKGVSVGPSKTILFGIIHGTYSDNTGGKLAMVTPSYYVFDLLKHY
jgi:hypothetical protein